jgi:secreted PhoX family phosphatase
VLRGGLAGLVALMAPPLAAGCSSEEEADKTPTPSPIKRPTASNLAAIGALGAADASGLRLPPGFTGRIVARTDQKPVANSDYVWHTFPDGGATFETTDGGWVYVSNSELPLVGGVGALRFDRDGNLVDAYRILDKTSANCAGGPTPWNTWLSCEEVARGRVFECDPFGKTDAIVRPALGVFKHEAATVDPVQKHLYLTEDEEDGCFYRFVPAQLTPDGNPDLTAGVLQVAQVAEDKKVTWIDLPDPEFKGQTPTRAQIAAATRFDGGEGIVFHQGIVYFSTKGDNRVWAYHTGDARMEVLYDAATAANPILTGVDNLTVTCCGDVLVAEDGGDMQVVAILADGSLKPLVQVEGHQGSEVTGIAFDPSGMRLYFSSQRGENGKSPGVTYEITGPFHLG